MRKPAVTCSVSACVFPTSVLSGGWTWSLDGCILIKKCVLKARAARGAWGLCQEGVQEGRGQGQLGKKLLQPQSLLAED